MSYEEKIAGLTKDDLKPGTQINTGQGFLDLNAFPKSLLVAISKKILQGLSNIEIARWVNTQLVEEDVDKLDIDSTLRLEWVTKLGIDTNRYKIVRGASTFTGVKAKAHIARIRKDILARKKQLEGNDG